MSKNQVLAADSTVFSPFASLLKEATGLPAGKVTATDRQRLYLEAVRDQAKRDGFDSGYRSGLEEGRAKGKHEGFASAQQESRIAFGRKLNEFAADLGHVQDLVLDGVNTWFGYAEEELEKLAIDIAREVIGQELKISRDAIRGIVLKSLKEVTLSREARIRVNPMDVESLRESKDLLIASCAQLRSLEIVDDPTILGGCIIETDGGVVDATVDRQLERLEAA